MTLNDNLQAQILCVDDERGILRALRRVLMDEDCEVLLANSGAEGLEIIQQSENLALIISDQRMPEMTGVDFLQQAKELLPDVHRVMLTGYADINATMDAVNKGQIWRYITKPWEDEQLIMLVRDALRQHELVNQNNRLEQIVKKQNEELKQWNKRLKQRVLEQTNRIREKQEIVAQQNRNLRVIFEQSLMAFSSLVESHDKSLRNHATNTAAVAERVALKLKLAKNAIKDIHAAALLHNIGKLGIPNEILHKLPEELSPNEKVLFSQYTVRGQTVLDPMDNLRPAGIIIRHILECYDGSGTPDNLKGEDIPVGSRIIAIAEQIDRQLSVGTYGNIKQIANQCRQQAGSRFDPAIVTLVIEEAQAYYAESLHPANNAKCLELSPADLQTGMVLLRDIHSGTGLLLLKRGSTLSEESIKSLKRYYASDPPKKPILVLEK